MPKPATGRAVNILAVPRGTLDLTVQILPSPHFQPISLPQECLSPSPTGAAVGSRRKAHSYPVEHCPEHPSSHLLLISPIPGSPAFGGYFLDQRLSRSHVRILVALYEAAADGGATITQLVERTKLLPRRCFHCAEPCESARSSGLPKVARPKASSVSPSGVPMKARREKVFGPGRAVPQLDGNAKGSHCQLRQGLERPRNKQHTNTQGADHPRLPGGPLRRCLCMASTTAAPVPASRPTRRLPPRRSAIAAQWRRP